MRIAIDGRTIAPGRSGVGTYAERLVYSLLQVDKENEYFLFLVQPNEKLNAPNLTKIIISGYNRLILNRWWENILLPGFMRRLSIDVFFSPAYALPMLPRFRSIIEPLPLPASVKAPFNSSGRVKFVVTVHDVISDVLPETFTAKMRLWQSVFNSNAVKVADNILTDSECTKRDFLRIYHCDEKKITVLYPSLDDRFRRVTNKSLLKTVRQRYSLPDSFILYLGTIEPRKNITGLAKAYALLPPNLRNKHRLVICGAIGWHADRILSDIQNLGLGDSIKMLGYVDHEHLPSLYSLANVFVFPSLYEGFGYPPLEAMACGTPVITSNRSSLPEVVEGAGIMVDPDNHSELSHQIQKILVDASLREKLRKKGYKRAEMFEGKTTAKKLLTILNQTVKEAN